MAQSLTIPIGCDLDLERVVFQLSEIFRQDGYTVTSYPNGGSYAVDFQKNTDGIHQVIGTVEGLRVNLTRLGEGAGTSLFVHYSDEEWTSKIISFVVGWFCCWLTWIGCGIGIYRQFQLSKNINNALLFICTDESRRATEA